MFYSRSSGAGRRWVPTHQQVLACALGIARGMAHLHGNGVIHRDLKSPNLLLNTAPTGPWRKTQDSREPAPVMRITDFGLSREAIPAPNQRLTMNLKVGTPVWMSPELLDKQADYSNKVDLYSFAVVLSELLSCELPWKNLAAEGTSLEQAVLEQGRRPELAADTPHLLRDVVEACWRQDAEARPTFDQVVELLERGLDARMSQQQRESALIAVPSPLWDDTGNAPRGSRMGASSSDEDEVRDEEEGLSKSLFNGREAE